MSTPETPTLRSEPLARQLSALGVWLLVINGIIGAGTFGLPADAARLALLFTVCACLTAITVVGTRNAMSSLGVLTLLKFVPLVALVGYGLLRMPDAMRESVLAGEACDPRRDMPRALFCAIGVVAILYFGLQTVSLALLPDIASTRRPLVEVSGELLGPVGALVMMTGMAASVGGNLAGALFSTPRITYALALDGSLPEWFATVSARFGTPSVSILVFGAVAEPQ